MTLKKKHLALWIPRLFIVFMFGTMLSSFVAFVGLIPALVFSVLTVVTALVGWGVAKLAYWCGYHSDDETPLFRTRKGKTEKK